VEQERAENDAIHRLETRLANEHYVANAPEAVVAQTREHLAEAKLRLENIKAEAARFRG